jgi:hypothetical protein
MKLKDLTPSQRAALAERVLHTVAEQDPERVARLVPSVVEELAMQGSPIEAELLDTDHEKPGVTRRRGMH